MADNLRDTERPHFGDEGNTSSSSPAKNGKRKPQPVQRKWWRFTWNNYPEDGIESLKSRFENCPVFMFQEETGKEGTPHLQGVVQCSKKIRWTAFNLPQSIHWDVCDYPQEAIAYCSKEETRTGQIVSKGVAPPLRLITPDRQYQKEVLQIVTTEPDDRTVNWFWEHRGNVGKSALTKYLCAKHDAVFIDGGKASDIAFHVVTSHKAGNPLRLIVIDLPRGASGLSYRAIESMKNGMVFSSKYECSQLLFNSPHVIIFANWPPPNMSQLSSDRWLIKEIKEDYSTRQTDINDL